MKDLAGGHKRSRCAILKLMRKFLDVMGVFTKTIHEEKWNLNRNYFFVSL